MRSKVLYIILFVGMGISTHAQKKKEPKPYGSSYGLGYYYNGNNNYFASYGFWAATDSRGGKSHLNLLLEGTSNSQKNFYALTLQGFGDAPYFFIGYNLSVQTDFTHNVVKFKPMLGLTYKGYINFAYSYSINSHHTYDGSSHSAVHIYANIFSRHKK